MIPMSKRIAMVTGANRGLGRAAAVALARSGSTVVLVCRDRARGEDALSEVLKAGGEGSGELLLADLSDMTSVRRVAGEFMAAHTGLDVLINNAAVYVKRRQVTAQGLELMFATNHLGPFLLTNLLLDALRAGAPARVINVSAPSTTRLDFDDLQGERRFGSLHAFGASKAANLLFTYELAQRLRGSGVTANVFFPNLMRTGLMREGSAPIRFIGRMGAKPPEVAAEALAWLATSRDIEGVTGSFFKLRDRKDTKAYSHDPEVRRRLWEASERLAGLAP
jgi:NAD(P)-dependent dehydrogenase (short-subunit alcohol dehydrogenase family)